MFHLGKIKCAALVSIALMAGCSSNNDGTESAEAVRFSVIGSGVNLTAGTEDPKVLEAYTDQAAYDSALNTYNFQVDGEVIDFASEQIVLVSMGSRSTGGHTLMAESVKDAGDFIELNLQLISPGANCIVTTAFTHPYQVLKINSQKEVRTIERTVIDDTGCSTTEDGVGSETPEPTMPANFSVIGSGSFLSTGTVENSTSFDGPKLQEVYSDQAAYEGALNRFALQLDSSDAIDFSTEQVVLLSMGTQNSGGYTIAVESVNDAGEFIELNVVLSSPGAGCLSIGALTHPYQVVTINSLKEVRIIERSVSEDCGF